MKAAREAYYPTPALAETARQAALAEFPEARIVFYTKGWAVQTRKSGDYLNAAGRPTMEARLEAFFA